MPKTEEEWRQEFEQLNEYCRRIDRMLKEHEAARGKYSRLTPSMWPIWLLALVSMSTGAGLFALGMWAQGVR